MSVAGGIVRAQTTPPGIRLHLPYISLVSGILSELSLTISIDKGCNCDSLVPGMKQDPAFLIVFDVEMQKLENRRPNYVEASKKMK